MEKTCRLWLKKKNRFCANTPLKDSQFCGNHKPGSGLRIPCPIDPSHSILQENLDAHVERCPLKKQVQALEMQPFYQKGINTGVDEYDLMCGVGRESNSSMDLQGGSLPQIPVLSSDVSCEMKRNAIYKMSVHEFSEILRKIEKIHSLMVTDIQNSYSIPQTCRKWLERQGEGKLPFKEKHALQQASILGNLENFGILPSVGNSDIKDPSKCNNLSFRDQMGPPAVIEFGAGRGYLTQMLTDCYDIKRVYLVERKSYKLKADRSLRQKESMILERLRIDIEDLNLNGVDSLMGVSFLAIGKHLCGPATDLTLRCCLRKQYNFSDDFYFRGLAIATCCHHLCQWKSYINKIFFKNLGLTMEDFHAITWFTSWSVDDDHSSRLPCAVNHEISFTDFMKKVCDAGISEVEEIVRHMQPLDRASLGIMCKGIIDMGRLMWIREHGLEARLVNYVPSSISPENHLLVAKCCK